MVHISSDVIIYSTGNAEIDAWNWCFSKLLKEKYYGNDSDKLRYVANIVSLWFFKV